MSLIPLIPLAVLSALFYRLGGMGDDGRMRYPNVPGWLFHTKARDIGCPLISLGALFILGIANVVPWWINLIAFLAMFGSLTTYYDSVPFNKGKDNFWMHGLGIGLAYAPYAFFSVGVPGAPLIRAVVLAVGIGLWSLYNDKAWLEESGRGFLIIATLPLMLI